jgi:energy-coupling factor transporter transmembrane protein EcfT
MDRTLLFLLAFSLVLIMLFAPHATVTLMAVLALSAIATRIAWATLQYLSQSQQAFD